MKDIVLEMKNFNNLIVRTIANLPSVLLLKNITGANGYILKYLVLNKDKIITQKDIEVTFGITRSTASTILTTMEKKDLIVRNISNKDSRMRTITITPKGLEIHNYIEKELKEFEEKIGKNLTNDELQVFFNVIEKMKKNICNSEVIK